MSADLKRWKSDVTTALLLIAHGSRQAEANAELLALARTLREDGHYAIVEPAFLELAEPTIEAATRTCIGLGAARVILLPYFLSAGVHVRRDLQSHRDKLAAAHPGAEFVLAEPLGPHPLLRAIVLERARAADTAAGS
jgi:sirohydrochlorin ferrochelatase